MPALALLFAVFVVGFEQFVQSRYGTLGVAGLLLLTIGYKARNHTCSCLGAAVLTFLFARP